MNSDELLAFHHHVVAVEYLLNSLSQGESGGSKEFWRMRAFTYAVSQWHTMPPDELQHITRLNLAIAGAIANARNSAQGEANETT